MSDSRLLEVARQINDLTDATAITRTIADLYNEIGDDAVSLTQFIVSTRTPEQQPTLADMARAARDLRNDPQVSPMLDRLKSMLLGGQSSDTFLKSKVDLALRLAQQLGLPTEKLEAALQKFV